MEVSLPALLWHYDRQTNQQTNAPTDMRGHREVTLPSLTILFWKELHYFPLNDWIIHLKYFNEIINTPEINSYTIICRSALLKALKTRLKYCICQTTLKRSKLLQLLMLPLMTAQSSTKLMKNLRLWHTRNTRTRQRDIKTHTNWTHQNEKYQRWKPRKGRKSIGLQKDR